MSDVFEHVRECESGCNLHVLRSIWEVLSVLWSRVLWAMRSCMTDDHHDRAVRVHPLGHAEKVDAVIGDQICEIVLDKESKYHEYIVIIRATRLKSHIEKGKQEARIGRKMQKQHKL